jgi:hypothetical protein
MKTDSSLALKVLAALGLMSIGAATALLAAGPLNPPAGVVSSTNKTLSELEPRIALNLANTPGDATSVLKITQRGSYYLTASFTGLPGRNGIVIDAPDVTLDLNGFSIQGAPGTLNGVLLTNQAGGNIVIKNGVLRSWIQSGIDMSASISGVISVEDMRISGCGSHGIIGVNDVTVARCNLTSNGGRGVSLGTSCTVTDTVANANALIGFLLGDRAVVTRCVARTNGGAGFDLGSRISITQCEAISNGGAGYRTSLTGRIDRCNSMGNTGHGVLAGQWSSVTACHVTNSQIDGINVGSESTVQGCTVSNSTQDGVSTGSLCNVLNCTVGTSGRDGIRTGAICTVQGNTCVQFASGPFGAIAIHVSGDCTVSDNHCSNHATGIKTDFGGNFIVRNTCSDNGTNWNISFNNLFGPVVDLTAAVDPGFNGNAAASSISSTHPNANFSR